MHFDAFTDAQDNDDVLCIITSTAFYLVDGPWKGRKICIN